MSKLPLCLNYPGSLYIYIYIYICYNQDQFFVPFVLHGLPLFYNPFYFLSSIFHVYMQVVKVLDFQIFALVLCSSPTNILFFFAC